MPQKRSQFSPRHLSRPQGRDAADRSLCATRAPGLVTRYLTPCLAPCLTPCLALCLALGVTAALTGCRSRPGGGVGTSVAVGDSLQGHLPVGRQEQAFTFEGVESSLLDFTLQADRGNDSSPDIQLFDPEGQTVPVDVGQGTPHGAATMRVSGLTLTKTGTYKLRVTPPATGSAVYYQFQHALRFPAATPRMLHLSATEVTPVYVPAPRYALIAVHITPRRSGVVPQIEGVEDPWGGRALDPAEVPKGALPPRVSHAADGTLTLTFTTPRPGTYAILAGAQSESSEGPAYVRIEVRPTRPATHVVRHPNSDPGAYGLPGATSPDASESIALPPPALPEDPSLATR